MLLKDLLMREKIINKKWIIILMAIFIFFILCFILIRFKIYRDDLFEYSEFINEQIIWYGSLVRTEPDSMSDIIKFSEAPNTDWASQEVLEYLTVFH